MREIDADVLYPDCLTKDGRLAISQSQIANAPTVNSRICTNIAADYEDVDQFVCSKCGIELQDWHSVERCDDGEIIFHDYTFRYCPHCGAKIKNDHVEGGDQNDT